MEGESRGPWPLPHFFDMPTLVKLLALAKYSSASFVHLFQRLLMKMVKNDSATDKASYEQ